MKKHILTGACVAVLLSGPWAMAQNHIKNHKALNAEMNRIQQKYKKLVTILNLGKSAMGRDILAAQIGGNEHAPAVAIVANLEADRLEGSAAALSILDALAARGEQPAISELLKTRTVFIIPRVDADGAEAFFQSVKTGSRLNSTPFDADLDGLTDEDGPQDLNGDGLITTMRRKEAGGQWLPHDDLAPLMIEADRFKNQRGQYRLYSEGMDSDLDGRYNEDGPGGVNLNRNFPHDYAYHAEDAGAYMTSEPAVRSLLDFFINHRNIGLVLTFSDFDNLRTLPKASPTKPESSGYSRKLQDKIDKDDLALLKVLSQSFDKTLPETYRKALNADEKPKGAFHQWVYFQYGALALTTPAWLPPQTESKTDGFEEALYRYWQQADPSAYLAWQPYEHPQLGSVEIGGWRPYAHTVPAEADTALYASYSRFAELLLKQLPQIRVAEFKAVHHGATVYQIKVVIENTGFMPTTLAHGDYAQAVMPGRAAIKVDGGEISAGSAMQHFETLEGAGGTQTLYWTVTAQAGSHVRLSVWTEKAGQIQQTLTLK